MLIKSNLRLGLVTVVLFAICALQTVLAQQHASVGGSKLRHWTSLPYDHREVPLFSIYGPFDTPPNASTLAKAKPALDVFDFQEVTLADDDKGITLQLIERDRRRLARFAQKHSGKWFAVVVPPKDIYRASRSWPRHG